MCFPSSRGSFNRGFFDVQSSSILERTSNLWKHPFGTLFFETKRAYRVSKLCILNPWTLLQHLDVAMMHQAELHPPKLTWNSQKKWWVCYDFQVKMFFFSFPSSFSRGCRYVVSQKLPAQRFTFNRNIANKKFQTMSNLRNLSHGRNKKHSYVPWNTGCVLGILTIFIMVYSPHSGVAFHPRIHPKQPRFCSLLICL